RGVKEASCECRRRGQSDDGRVCRPGRAVRLGLDLFPAAGATSRPGPVNDTSGADIQIAASRVVVDFPRPFCYWPAPTSWVCGLAPRPRIGIQPLNSKGAPCVQVLVRDNNVDQALKALKKKMQREGIFREMKLRGHYEKPSEKKARERAEAIR